MLYRCRHGVSANIIPNKLNVGVFRIHKYVDIVVDALVFKDELFNQYIFMPHGPPFLRIMDGFFDACGLPNVCSAIDGSHISLSQILNKHVITILTNYSYR